MKKSVFPVLLPLLVCAVTSTSKAQSIVAPTKQASNLQVNFRNGAITWTNGNGNGRTIYVWNYGINKFSTAKNPTSAFSVKDNVTVEVSTFSGDATETTQTITKTSPTGGTSTINRPSFSTDVLPVGTWVCIYDGSGSSASIPTFNLTNRYYVCVFEYNGMNGAQVYNKTIVASNTGNYLTGGSGVPQGQ